MNNKLFELAQHREVLLERISAQREQLIDEIDAEWQAPLALADQGMAAVRYLRHHPMLVSAIMVFYLIRRRSVAGFAWGAWRAWKGYRDLTSISAK
jgi:hypothetical protein